LNQVAFSLPSRLIAKIYLFRTIFNRGKGYAFTVDPAFMHVSTSVKFWDDIGVKFYSKYKGLAELYNTNERLVLAGKPLEGPLGRFWPIELVRDFRGDLVVPETLLLNYPVQGTGADVMMIARISFTNKLKKTSWGKEVKQIATVHDSLVADVPDHLVVPTAELYVETFRDLVPNIRKIFGYDWQTPLECECKAGPNMKDQEELKLFA
jgi:hypothetical protein